MYRTTKLLRNTSYGLVFFILTIGWFSQTIFAQCTPVAYQKTFQKVYRQHKLFLEGLADLTGDGKPDVYGYQLQSNNTFQNLAILPNDGNGGFGDPIIINTTFAVGNKVGTIGSHFFGNVSIGDLNLDGKLDMVVQAETTPSAIFSLQNNGSNSFTQMGVTALGINERIFQIADFNNDGRGDLLTVIVHPRVDDESGVLNGINYRLGNSDGTFGASVQLVNNFSTYPALGDFNNDNKIDIALTYSIQSVRYFKVLTNLGGGIFSSGTPTQADYYDVAGTADFNNDGKTDVFANGTHETVVLINDGNGTFTRINYPNVTGNTTLNWYHQLSLIDYNGDGHKDILHLVNRPSSSSPPYNRQKSHSIFLNNGSGSFTRIDSQNPYLGIPFDINGDNKTEQVIFVNSTTGATLNSATNETVVIVKQATCIPPPVAGQVKILDFGGDGISDIAVWNPSNGDWSYGSNTTSGTINWGLGSHGDIPAPGDYDSDGKTDVAVYRNTTGYWYIRKSSDNTWFIVKFGVTDDKPVPADYNGDGKSDIAVFRPSDGNWYILISGTSEIIIMHWGISEDKPVPQDYDGDSKTDLAVFRPSTGIWYYLKSSDGGFVQINWGLSTDIPVPADYDTDGKADLAVFRPDTRIWYIYRSFDNEYSYVYFGVSGDVPMVVDSNGDGVIEPAFYHPSNKTWWTSAQETVWGGFGFTQEVPVRFMLPNN